MKKRMKGVSMQWNSLRERGRESVCVSLCVYEKKRERMRKILFLNIYKLFFHSRVL